MTSSIEAKILRIFDELKKQGHITPRRVLKASKKVSSFKSSVYTSNTILYNPNLSDLDDDVIRFSLLHEEGHLARGQYGPPALLLLWSFGLIPLIIGIFFKTDFFLISLFFFLFVFFSSIRILTEPFYWDEFGSDEFASKILHDSYKIKKPSEIVRTTLNSIPSSFDYSNLFHRICLAFIEYHPSTEQRVRNVIEVVDEK